MNEDIAHCRLLQRGDLCPAMLLVPIPPWWETSPKPPYVSQIVSLACGHTGAVSDSFKSSLWAESEALGSGADRVWAFT